MNNQSMDNGFEQYRLERKRRRLTSGEAMRPQAANNDALRMIEEAEMKEVKDRRMSSDVQNFFQDATQAAATLVQRVSTEKESVVKEQLVAEMQEFMMMTIRRVESLVIGIQNETPSQVAERTIEPEMHNLVGRPLDEFRYEGNSSVSEKHIGVDPFTVEDGTGNAVDDPSESDLDPSQYAGLANYCASTREEAVSDAAPAAPVVAPVAPVAPTAPVAQAAPAPVAAPAKQVAAPVAAAAVELDDELAGHLVADLVAESTPAAPASSDREKSGVSPHAEEFLLAAKNVLGALVEDEERYKKVLRVLVQQSFMSKDEARALFRANKL